MKKLFYLLTFVTLFYSCKNEDTPTPVNGSVSFSFSAQAKKSGKVNQTAAPAFALVSIEDAQGKPVEQNKKIALTAFGNGFVSETLQLKQGDYKLTLFIITDLDGKALYASPLLGSDQASKVQHPLPVAFSVGNSVSTIVPEVLAVGETDTPESFGYVNFGFEVVNVCTFTIPLETVNEIDSAVIILTKNTDKMIRQFKIDPFSAKAIISGISIGDWETEVRTFKVNGTPSSTWYNKPSWESQDDQAIEKNARFVSRLKSSLQVSGGYLAIQYPMVKDKSKWVDYYFNTMSGGTSLFFNQDPWKGIFLEVEIPGTLTLDYVHVDKDIYWVAADASGYTDQSFTVWDMCADKNQCTYDLPQNKHSFFFQLSKPPILNEICCQKTSVYITCRNTKNTSISDFKSLVFCSDKN